METVKEKENKINSLLTSPEKTKASGIAMAAILSGTIGCFTIGLMIVFAEASKNFKDWLNWWNPAGPLVGKTGMGVIVWLVSWMILYFLFGKKEKKVKPIAIFSFVLLILALLFSFPPFFDLFTSK